MQGELDSGQGNRRGSVNDMCAFVVPAAGPVESSRARQISVLSPGYPEQTHSVNCAVVYAYQQIVDRLAAYLVVHKINRSDSQRRANLRQPK